MVYKAKFTYPAAEIYVFCFYSHVVVLRMKLSNGKYNKTEHIFSVRWIVEWISMIE